MLASVTYNVRLITGTDGLVLIGPFPTAEAASAWLEAMPDDGDVEDADVIAVAAPFRNDGEPNY
jgi:hypothetical protein